MQILEPTTKVQRTKYASQYLYKNFSVKENSNIQQCYSKNNIYKKKQTQFYLITSEK